MLCPFMRSSSCLAVLLVTFSASLVHAQLDTGVIVGTVTDSSGAVLPGVTVTATQEGTGVALHEFKVQARTYSAHV